MNKPSHLIRSSKYILFVISLLAIIAKTETAIAAVAKNKSKAKEIQVQEEASTEELTPNLVVSGPESGNVAIETSANASTNQLSAESFTMAQPNSAAMTGQMESEATAAASTATSADAKKDINKMPENQIPVLANPKSVKKSESGAMNRILMTLGVLVALLGGTLFGLKRWSAKKGFDKKHTQIKILTQHALGPKKNLAIVQVAGEAILIGVTDHNISMLKTLSLIDEEIPESTPRSFDSAMDDFDDDFVQESTRGRAIRSAGDDEDFAIQGLGEIRDRVTKRVKGNRSF